MRNLYFLFLIFVLCCIHAWANEVAAIPNESPLNKPVTIEAKGESLSDIMAMLSKQSGVKLRVTRAIADQKATIFVDKMPLSTVLNGISAIFNYRLSAVKLKDSTIYELWESPKAKLAREAAIEGTLGAAFQELDKRVREVSQMSPEAQDSMLTEVDGLIKRNLNDEHLTEEERKRMMTNIQQAGLGATLAKLYASLPADYISAIRSGCTIYFDSDTTESKWRLSQALLNEINRKTIREIPAWNSGPDGGCNVGLTFDIKGDILSAHFFAEGYWTKAGPGEGKCIQMGSSPGGDIPIGKVNQDEPEIKLPYSTSVGVLDKEVSFTTKELIEEANLYGETESQLPVHVNRSDIQSLLHKKIGMQSISDHHSTWYAWDVEGTQTAKYILDHINEMIDKSDMKEILAKGSLKSDPTYGWDGKCIYMRERYPYELDVAETPNRIIRKLRTNLSENRFLNIDDVADIASLTDGQESILKYFLNWDRLIKIRGVDYSDTDRSNEGKSLDPTIRFYSSLTDIQKRALRSSGIRTADLRVDQLDLLAQCTGKFIQEDQSNADSSRRVGVWWKSTRIDQPQSGSMMPVQVKLTKFENQAYVIRIVMEGENTTGSDVTASSSKDAWDQFVGMYPDLSKRPYFFGKNIGYVMVFTFSDGSTKVYPIEFFQPVL